MSKQRQPRQRGGPALEGAAGIAKLRNPTGRSRQPRLRPVVELDVSSPTDSDSLGGARISETCPDNATTTILLVLAAQCRALFMEYYYKRSGDSVWEWGRWDVALDLSHANPEKAPQGHRPDGQALGATGTTFAFTLAGPGSAWLALEVTVDNSSANDVDFYAIWRYIPL